MGLVAALPLTVGLLPEAHDVLFHLYRLVQLDDLIREGVFYSRWAPAMAYGFGYPIFNYYAPFVYYVSEVFHLLGLSAADALLVTFALALVLASLAMYLWTRDFLGGAGALVASAAYVFAPYMMINTLFRAALAEVFALALMPLILYLFFRFARTLQARYAVGGVLAYVALLLTHNISALVFTPVLMLYSLLLALILGRKPGREGDAVGIAGRMALLMVLGLGLTAFFWLPALTERDYVHIYQLYMPSVFNFEANFLSLRELLSPPVTVDPRLVDQSAPISLGIVALILALLSPLVLWRSDSKARRDSHAPDYRSRGQILRPEPSEIGVRRGHLILGWVGLVASTLMALSISTPLWEVLPLIRFLQFPWRFLGPASFFLALLAGIGTEVLSGLVPGRVARRGWITALLVGGLALYALPWQYVRHYPPLDGVTMVDAVEFERRSGSVGTTTTGEYLPISVQERPSFDNPALLDASLRLDAASLPAGAEILEAQYAPLRYTVTVTSPEPFTIVFTTFDFPGWKAEVDGERMPITPTGPHGLIGVALPEGRHRVEVWFGSTGVRVRASALSLLSLAALVAMGLLLARHDRGIRELPERRAALSPWAALGTLVVLGVVVAFKILNVDVDERESIFRRTRFDGQRVSGVDLPLEINFDGRLVLLGADLPGAVPSGDVAEVTLYWRVPARVTTEYSVGARLVNKEGFVVAQHDNQHPGGFPTTRWEPSGYGRDPHPLLIHPGTPPGTYILQVGVYPYGRPEEGLNVLDAGGAPVGREVDVATLTVTRPEHPLDPESVTPQVRLDAPLDRGLRLLGYDLPHRDLRAGERLPLYLTWQAASTPEADLEVRLELRDEAGLPVVSVVRPPVTGYPTSQWRAGDLWRGPHRLLLPPALSSGTYTLTVGMGEAPPVALAPIEVSAPDHLMEPPEMAYEADTIFGGLATLAGYKVEPLAVQVGEDLSVTLLWRVEEETRTDYKSFVHLLYPDGRLAVGSDLVPGEWQRPTTGWVVGEYILDPHVLQIPPELPPGTYALQAGLYDAEMLVRLTTDSEEDTLVLKPSIEVLP